MKILLVGEYYSDNLGDPLLCQTVETLIREAYPEAEIIPFDMCGRISAAEYYEPKTDPLTDKITKFVCDRFLYYRRAAICRAYDKEKARYLRVWYSLKELQKKHKFDLVIFAGGSLFMDYFAGIINLIIRRFAFSKTKILFHACGMSTLNEDAEYLLRQVLCSKKVASISLRDSYERFVELFPVKAKVRKTYDTALNCSRFFAPAKEKTAELGIGLIDRCYDQQMALIRHYMQSDIKWKAFTNGSVYDQEYAVKLLTDAGIPAEKLGEYLADRPLTTDDLIRTVTGFERIAAFRMHCQITAASFGIPSFGFAWDRKVTEFYEKLGFSQGCAKTIDDFEKVEKTLSQYDGGIHPRALTQGEESRKCLTDAIEMALGRKES